MIFGAVIVPVAWKPPALSNVAVAVGVIAPTAVVYTSTLVARLVSVKFSAATTSTRPVDELPNCKLPLLKPRPVNCDKMSLVCDCSGVAAEPRAVRPVNATYELALPNESCVIRVCELSAPEI